MDRLSSKLLIRIEPSRVMLFRYLLEGCDNLALFTVVDNGGSMLKLIFSPDQSREIAGALSAMRALVPFEVLPWPFSGPHPSC